MNEKPRLDVVHHMDALALLRTLPDGYVDMILADLPYGVTACEWDVALDLDELWVEFKRVVKDGGAVVLTATMRFAVDLINAAGDWFRDDLVWDKVLVSGFLDANRRPLRRHENILVFCERRAVYNPQMGKGEPYGMFKRANRTSGLESYSTTKRVRKGSDGERHPVSILPIPHYRVGVVHPTQKPVALFEYLIRTYSNAGDVVLDPTVGSGTTAIAARNTGRRYICGDVSRKYVEVARARLTEPYTPDMFEGQASGNKRGQAQQMGLPTAGE